MPLDCNSAPTGTPWPYEVPVVWRVPYTRKNSKSRRVICVFKKTIHTFTIFLWLYSCFYSNGESVDWFFFFHVSKDSTRHASYCSCSRGLLSAVDAEVVVKCKWKLKCTAPKFDKGSEFFIFINTSTEVGADAIYAHRSPSIKGYFAEAFSIPASKLKSYQWH